MCVHLCLCLCVCVCLHMYVHVCVYVFLCIRVSVHVCILCVYVCAQVCVYAARVLSFKCFFSRPHLPGLGTLETLCEPSPDSGTHTWPPFLDSSAESEKAGVSASLVFSQFPARHHGR